MLHRGNEMGNDGSNKIRAFHSAAVLSPTAKRELKLSNAPERDTETFSACKNEATLTRDFIVRLLRKCSVQSRNITHLLKVAARSEQSIAGACTCRYVYISPAPLCVHTFVAARYRTALKSRYTRRTRSVQFDQRGVEVRHFARVVRIVQVALPNCER